MSLSVVGLGPGPGCWLAPEAAAALAEASDLLGYQTYLDRVPHHTGQQRHASDNGAELERARHGFALAAAGQTVAIVTGGDPGVFGMAASVLEALEAGDPAWQAVALKIIPGISAMLAAAARLGAPLGHDFCAISLSDNLKPWPVIERRLRAAAAGDFVICLYNPASQARPGRIHDAFACLRALCRDTTPVAFARAVGGAGEQLHVTDLANADPGLADMRTLVLIGSSQTRLVPRAGQTPWLLTPRSYPE